jgi:hypothetical protein
MEMFILDNSKMALRVEMENMFSAEDANMKESGLMEKCMAME